METRLYIGDCEGKRVYLTKDDLIRSIHGMGLTRSGKSMLILWIVFQLIRQGKAFCLLDPHGGLYTDVLSWLVANSYRQPLVLFNPSYEKRVVGLDFFTTPYTDEGRKMTKAERSSQQLMKCFNLEGTDQFGNIERILRALFYTILDLNLSVCDLKYFLYWEFENERKKMIERVSSEIIHSDLKTLYSSKTEFEKKIGPTQNKLQRFIHPQMRRILGLKENYVNLSALIERQRVMLCNLQVSNDDLIGQENLRALGTLLISEFWQLFKKRNDYKEFYLIIDEAHEYLTPDLIKIFPASAKWGLHLIVFHQDQGQLTPAIASAIKNAQTKIFFTTEEHMKEQRQFTLRRANGEQLECETPTFKLPIVSPERIEQRVEYLTQYFLTPEEVDARLNKPHNEDKEVKPLSRSDLIR